MDRQVVVGPLAAGLGDRGLGAARGGDNGGALLTYGSLAAAVAAVAVAGGAGAPAAGGWLALAALLDTFDGRFARCVERTSRQCRVGCEIDSLVDVCAFGMGPVGVLEAVSPPGSGLQ